MSWQLAEKRRTKRFAVDWHWRWHWQTDSWQTANEALVGPPRSWRAEGAQCQPHWRRHNTQQAIF